MSSQGPTTTGSIDAKLTVDDSDFKRGMAEAKADAKEVGGLEPTVKVDANVASALAKLDAVAIAEQRVETAQRQATNTASAAYLASERLNAVMEKRGRTDLQVAVAEEGLARADRNAEAAEKKLILATEALNAVKAESARKSAEQAVAEDATTESTKRAAQAQQGNNNAWMMALHLAPEILAAGAPLVASTVGLGVAFGVMGAAGVAALKGIKDAMAVGDTVGNTYATGLESVKANLNALAGTSANAMLSAFNSGVGDLNSRMPFLSQMIGSASVALGEMGNTAIRGVLDGLRTMNPLIQAGQVELSKFVTWLFGFNGTNGFTQFIAYAINNLPATMQLIENLVTLAGHILAAFAPLGPVMLGVLNLITNGLNQVPLPVLAGIVTLGTQIGPAMSIAAGAINLLTPALEKSGGAMALFALESNLAVPVIGIITATLAGIGIAAATASMGTDKGAASMRDYTQALKDDNLAIGEHVQAQIAKELVDSGAAEAAQRLGLSLTTVQQAAAGNATAIQAVKNVTDDAAKSIIDWTSGGAYASEQNKRLSGDVDLMRNSVLGASGAVQEQLGKQKLLNEMLHPTTGAMTEQALAAQAQASQFGTTTAALQAAKDAQDKAGQSTADATIKMQLQNDAAGLLKMALDGLNGKAISAAQAQNAFDSSLVNMGDHVDKTGKKITFTTTSITDMSAASVALRGQLNGQVTNLQNVIEANGGLSNSTAEAKAQYADMRQKIIDNAVAHGVDKAAVEQYIDKLLAVPKSIPPTKLDVDNAAAAQKIADVQWRLDQLQTHKQIFIDVQQSTSNVDNTGGAGHPSDPKLYASGGRVAYLASGGVPNFKPVGTDTVPAMLTPDEFVVNRASAQSIGHSTLDYMNRTGQLPPGGQAQPVNVSVVVQNPFTGEEVQAVVKAVAVSVAQGAIGSAGRDAGRRPAR